MGQDNRDLLVELLGQTVDETATLEKAAITVYVLLSVRGVRRPPLDEQARRVMSWLIGFFLGGFAGGWLLFLRLG